MNSRADGALASGGAASIAFKAADAEGDVVGGDKRGCVRSGHDEARSRLVGCALRVERDVDPGVPQRGIRLHSPMPRIFVSRRRRRPAERRCCAPYAAMPDRGTPSVGCSHRLGRRRCVLDGFVGLVLAYLAQLDRCVGALQQPDHGQVFKWPVMCRLALLPERL
jgi:hypothetical protein